MGVFDGAAILAVEPAGGSGSGASPSLLRRVLGGGRPVLLPDGDVAVALRPPGFPATLPLAGDAGGGGDVAGGPEWDVRVGMVVALQPPVALLDRAGAADAVGLWRAVDRVAAAAGWRVTALACMPPVPIADLVVCRPLHGARTHVGVAGVSTTACGRLPLQGPAGHPGKVDCLRCLRSSAVAARIDAQLGCYQGLVALAGRLPGAVAARLWLRLGHRDPGVLPSLLDAMVGAIVYGVPGAPDAAATLVQVRRHRRVASEPVRRWAGEQARRRLAATLERVVPEHPSSLPDELRGELVVARDLLPAAEAADVLVTALEEHGPAPAVEPIAYQAAVAAGEAASARVQHWRRVHEVARALAGGGTAGAATARAGRAWAS